MKAALIALALAGCTGCQEPSQLPGQAQAVSLVWDFEYGRRAFDPPSIRWVEGVELDCDNGYAFYRGRWYGDVGRSEQCVGGVNWSDWRVCDVALPPGMAISGTAFAHELYHQALYDVTGDPDPAHADPGFGIAFGHPRGIVDVANEDLAREGL